MKVFVRNESTLVHPPVSLFFSDHNMIFKSLTLYPESYHDIKLYLCSDNYECTIHIMK